MATAERKLKLAERIQKDGQPHKFKRWVYLYHRHKSRIIAALLVVIAALLAGLIYVGWKLYEKEPGVVMRASRIGKPRASGPASGLKQLKIERMRYFCKVRL